MLVGCINKAFIQELSKHNIESRFKVTWMWSLNPRAMNDKILPYNYLFRWKKYNLDDEANGSHRWGEEFIVAFFMNITQFVFAIDGKDSNCLLSPNQRYHVEMPRSPTTIKRLQEVDEPNWFIWTMNIQNYYNNY
jgi:hypothetical protein